MSKKEKILLPLDDAQFLLQCLMPLSDIAKGAGSLIMDFFHKGFETTYKDDDSPVTQADLTANTYICTALDEHFPMIPIISEEKDTLREEIRRSETFFLIDPLDGTRQFIAQKPCFTVNIALIHRGTPILGILYAPALKRLYAGIAGYMAWIEREDTSEKETIFCPPSPHLVWPAVSLGSSSHHKQDISELRLLEGLGITETIRTGSAYKFGLMLERKACIYPRFSPVMEWDVAAGHALLKAIGGDVFIKNGEPLRYGETSEWEVPHFIACTPSVCKNVMSFLQ